MKEKKSVLVIDDDESIAKTLTRILARNGYETDIAQSGREAIEKLRVSNYDVALVDVRLQDADGADLLAEMPENSIDMVKIVVTGYPSTENRLRAEKNGADAYLEKPISPEKLLEVIAAKLQETGKQKALRD